METTSPPPVLTSVTTPSSNPLVRAWVWLTTPHPSVPVDKRQRVVILMSMLAVFVPLAFSVVFSGPISFALTGTGTPELVPAAVVAILIVITAYVISRTRYYEIAGYMVVFVPTLAVFGVVFTSDAPPRRFRWDF